jgi:hypothetical protein
VIVLPGWGPTGLTILTPLRPHTEDRPPPTSGFDIRGRDGPCGRAHSRPTEASSLTHPEWRRPDEKISGDSPDVAGGHRPIRDTAAAPPPDRWSNYHARVDLEKITLNLLKKRQRYNLSHSCTDVGKRSVRDPVVPTRPPRRPRLAYRGPHCIRLPRAPLPYDKVPTTPISGYGKHGRDRTFHRQQASRLPAGAQCKSRVAGIISGYQRGQRASKAQPKPQ